MDAQYTEWIRRWQAALDACRRKGGEASKLVIAPPASEEEVAKLEAEIGTALPISFRRVLTEFSAEVDVAWMLPDGAELPANFKEIFRSQCDWNFECVIELNAHLKRLLLTDYITLGEDWHNALLFSQVANGDYLAFDMQATPDPPVVYLSHEDYSLQEQRLGDNFTDFMERWSLLGCPGNEDWQMMPFLPDTVSGLDAYGENARKWRKWFGLDFEVDKP